MRLDPIDEGYLKVLRGVIDDALNNSRILGDLAVELGIPDDESIIEYIRRVTTERDKIRLELAKIQEQTFKQSSEF